MEMLRSPNKNKKYYYVIQKLKGFDTQTQNKEFINNIPSVPVSTIYQIILNETFQTAVPTFQDVKVPTDLANSA